jgi:hypothetical protein
MPPKIALPVADTGPPPPTVPEWLNSNEPTAVPVVSPPRMNTNPKQRHCAAVAELTGVRAPETAPNSGDVFALPSRRERVGARRRSRRGRPRREHAVKHRGARVLIDRRVRDRPHRLLRRRARDCREILDRGYEVQARDTARQCRRVTRELDVPLNLPPRALLIHGLRHKVLVRPRATQGEDRRVPLKAVQETHEIVTVSVIATLSPDADNVAVDVSNV